MKVALLYPPLGSITHPYSSLAYLTAHLRSAGHEVMQCDAGMAAVDRMLRPAFLARMRAAARERGDRLSRRRSLSPPERKARELCRSVELFAGDVIANVESAKAILRSRERFYDPREYMYAANLLRRAFETITAVFYPTVVTPADLYMGGLTLARLHRFTHDEGHNPFLMVLRDEVLPGLWTEAPAVVGISVTYYPQAVAGFTLARLVKERWPKTHVVMGGAIVSAAEPRLRADARAFRWVDSYVFGEGEGPLLALVESLAEGLPASGPDRLFSRQSRRRPSQPQSKPVMGMNFNQLPSPDFSGLNLEDFLSPEPVFLVANARGCYYRKCAFCNFSLTLHRAYRQRSCQTLFSDLRALREKHGARFISFADDCIPPRRCLEIADFFQGQAPPFYWQTMVRHEPGFTPATLKRMRASGCRQLSFGNESSNQRVLDLMRKGTKVSRSEEIASAVQAAGLGQHMYNFMGFPGETLEEAKDTLDFLTRHQNHITSFALILYRLVEFSPVHLQAEAFGVSAIRALDDKDLVPEFSFEVNSGAKREEMRDFIQEAIWRLAALYPGQDELLDRFGAHSLLLLTHHNRTRLEDIFPLGGSGKALLTERLKLDPRVLSRELGQKTLLYNPATARSYTLEKDARALVKLLDGAHTLKDISSALRAQPDPPGPKKVEAVIMLMSLAHDLKQGGFLDRG